MRIRRVAWATALLLLGSVLAPPRAARAAPEPAGPRWTYRVRVAEDLKTLAVRADFAGFPPRRMGMADGHPPRGLTLSPESTLRLTPDPEDPVAFVADSAN